MKQDVAGIASLVRRTIFIIFACALLAGSAAFFLFFRSAAIDHVEDESLAMMDAALAVRAYTVDEVRPIVKERSPNTFHQQSVPSYAAQSVFQRLSTSDNSYSYREAALNPTNPDDLATNFEARIIKRFRQDDAEKSVSGLRETDSGTQFYQARPIRIQDKGCLECHSTPERAPDPMLAQYGSDGGFGWEMGEVVGVQMLTVPVDKEFATIYEVLAVFFAILVILFIVVSIFVVRPLQRNVIRPLRELAETAERSSLRDDDTELPAHGAAEVRRLAESITRLRRSLHVAMHRTSEDDQT